MIQGSRLPEKLFGFDTRMLLLWLEPIALLLVFIVSFGLVIVPKINEVSEKMASVKSVTAKTKEVNQKRVYLQSVNQEEIKSNALKLASGLLPQKDAYLLVRIIRNVVAQSGYSIDDFAISMGDIKNNDETVKKDNSNFDKIPVSVTLLGPSENYIQLAKVLERSLPIMLIDNFEMRAMQGGVSVIKMSVSAYYLRDISNMKLENLKLVDLTPSQEEADLLSKIDEYQTMSMESSSDQEEFVKYQREDPFFTL